MDTVIFFAVWVLIVLGVFWWWAWLVASRQAESCLRQILPYLLTKRRQAQLALEARTYLGKPGRWSQQKPNWIALERLDRELHDLNKRGIT